VISRLITDYDALAGLAPAWRALALRSGASFFSSPGWLLTWWRHFGRARRLRVIAVEDEAGPVGLLPLMADRVGPVRRLQFLGTGGTDYLDALVRPGCEQGFWQAVVETLAPMAWHLADLQQVPAGSPTLQHLPLIAGRMGCEVTACLQEPCPFLALPGDWDAFCQGLGKKMRWAVGYYPRLAARERKAEVVRVQGGRVPETMDRLFALHTRRWRARWLPGAFAGPRTRRFHRELAAACDASGDLRLYALSLDGRVQAVLYCFAFGGRVHYYQGGFDPACARYSPGTILVAHAVREAIATGAQGFDFLRGGEAYKYRWGAVDRSNQRLLLVRPGWQGRLGRRLGLWQQEAEESVKKIAGKLSAPRKGRAGRKS